MVTTPAMAQFEPADVAAEAERIRKAVNRIVSDVLEPETAVLEQLGWPDTVRSLLLGGGGKRMRAQFCYWGWRAAGGTGSVENIDTVAAAMELNHAAYVIHDDIIDDSATRRGRPSMHRRLTDFHAEVGGHGSSADFGSNTALCMGDLCLAFADSLLSSCATSDTLAAALEVYGRMATDVSLGESLELRLQADRGYQRELCLKVAELKAGRYMLTPALRVGAVLANADAETDASLEDFGNSVGLAYQLRDDLLGAFGDPDVTGKSNLDDMRAGKPTVLFATALQLAGPDQRTRLLDLYGLRELDEAAADEVRSLLLATGVREEMDRAIRTQADSAAEALRAAPLVSEARTALLNLAERALFRNR